MGKIKGPRIKISGETNRTISDYLHLEVSRRNCTKLWNHQSTERTNWQTEIEKVNNRANQRIQSLTEKSFKINGPMLFNSLPKNLRNKSKCSVDEFKFELEASSAKIQISPRHPIWNQKL